MKTRLRTVGDFWLDGVIRVFFPPMCEGCGRGVDAGRLCGLCRRVLLHTADGVVCRRCAGSVGPHLDTAKGCALCRDDSFAFERVVRLGRYQGGLAEACLRIKKPAGARLAMALADLFCEVRSSDLRETAADAVVPIAVHWRKRWRSGHDHAAEIAGRLAKGLGIPLRRNWLWRTRTTPLQRALSPTDRRTNVRDSFAAGPRSKLAGRTILLVDDVLTTGATCHHAAKALRAAGAKSVFVAAIARGDDMGMATAVEPSPAKAGARNV